MTTSSTIPKIEVISAPANMPKAKKKKAKGTGRRISDKEIIELNEDGTFASEEDREKFINGDRGRRIQAELRETEAAFEKLEALSQAINEETRQITEFYYLLSERLRKYEIGYPFILKDEQNETKDQHYRLHHVEDSEGNLYFHRLGFAKLKDTLNNTWDIVVYKYRIEEGDPSRTEGPNVSHVFLDDKTARLTHASRDIRVEAAHVIGDFIQMFLRSISYNKHCVDSALRRIERLNELFLKAE
jgi:hypothetical protein